VSAGSEIRRFETLRARLPAAWIDLSHALPLVYLTGTLDLDLDFVELQDGLPLGGSGRIRWQDAGIGGAVREPLGTVELDIRPHPAGPGHGLLFDFRTAGEPELRVAGEGSLLGDEYALRLRLRVPEHRTDVRDLLAPLGEIGQDGEIRLQWHGKLFPREARGPMP
jgi:hypothetical protein